MANLSEDDCFVITEHPLDNSLDHLRDSLQKAEQSYESGSIDSDDAGNNADQGPLKAVSCLIAILLGHDVALTLHSKSGNGDLASELSTLFKHVRNVDFNYKHYRVLSQLVIKKAPDIDIWNAIFDLVRFISRLTPPPSVSVSFQRTPVVYSSASMQRDQQTKKLLESSLFDEIKNCTYRKVEGFFAKYFEGNKWSKRSKEIYEAMKARHVDGRWTDFPDIPGEHAVWNWLSRIQDEYLIEARGIYYKTSTSAELVGGEARRQLDFFIKRRTGTVDTSHDWKDVRVIGEHRASLGEWKKKILQISRYVRDVFSAQPTRRYVHAFTLLGTTMELWVFDRSGPYSSGAFDIHDKPENFIRALVGYTLMSDNELGLDGFIEHDGQGNSITIHEDKTGKNIKILLEQQPLVIQRAIVCRGTTCYRSKDGKKVVKLSWPSDLRPQEASLLRRARKCGVKGVATLVGHHDITSIKDMRDGLKFPPLHRFREASPLSEFQSPVASRAVRALHSVGSSQTSSGKKRKSIESDSRAAKKSTFNSLTSKLREEYEAQHDSRDEDRGQKSAQVEVYKNRIFSCLVISPAGRAIKDFRSIKELLTALRDAAKAHQCLFEKAKILHRDISENNIIITDPQKADGFTGMLIDLDLAIVDGERTGGRQMTGTMEFMAIDVLRGIKHTYRHDLESFFYVLLWICARRAWESEFQCSTRDRPRKSILGKWYGNDAADAADAKHYNMHADGFESILKEFVPAFDCIKPLCKRVREILFPHTRNGELDLTTKSDHRDLYSPFINAFDDAIADLETDP